MSVDTRWDKAVQDAITELQSRKGAWVGLCELRFHPRLVGTTREAQDRHLRRMSHEGKVVLAPESNQKALTRAARDAAVWIGNEDNHLIRIR
ncbi:hypothetical protein [Actinokineospora enzanensis]|uniref:hypothetical protein n=1 Tax=Actinokineospora enzanensis TaxID=155975 RepID=UPI0003815301|nr:hypothetical protein [Actinokineospora enzanensis]